MSTVRCDEWSCNVKRKHLYLLETRTEIFMDGVIWSLGLAAGEFGGEEVDGSSADTRLAGSQ